MVYIDSWDNFLKKSVLLFRSNPEKTRYAMKYRHCDGKLILKVTDDKECIKFKTDQAQDAKKMEKLNNIFFTLMAHGPEGLLILFQRIYPELVEKSRKEFWHTVSVLFI